MSKKNSNLTAAKDAKNDEFYTRLEDIENELRHYKEHFNDKVVLCPCDESEHTNFYKHFMLNFMEYGLKKLVCIGYRTNRPAEIHVVERTADGYIETNKHLIGNGDFRNVETQQFFDDSDIIVTNPPFSLFREFVDLLMKKDKKFLIIGNKNAITYKEIFPLIKEDKIWMGYTSPSKFTQLDKDELKNMTGLTRWFTNLDIKKRNIILDTGIEYEYGMKQGWYQKYDNYDAININKVNQIPMDYTDTMGVPITFLDKFNPNQFEILGITSSSRELAGEWLTTEKGSTRASLNGKYMYGRILIKKK